MILNRLKIKTRKKVSQLELPIQKNYELDRNFHVGGRSFYFFDFDDNIAYLKTPTFLFHKVTKKTLVLTSGEFAKVAPEIGRSGYLKDYEINFDDEVGSFRNFRDRDFNALHRLAGKKQFFIEDLMEALGGIDHKWKGPSWSCFYHAVFNKRPVALITARGHHPDTIKKGIKEFVRDGHLPYQPNYLTIFPVNHPLTKKDLSQGKMLTVAELKRVAIRRSVEKAFQVYGENPHHRFGMSDDDPKNIELIIKEMTELKKDYPQNSFFVIETHSGQFFKKEIFYDHIESHAFGKAEQLDLLIENPQI
jgi:hypothetical protein